MSTNISPNDLWGLIKDRPPREEGDHLAEKLLSNNGVDWNDLTVDLRGMPIELLNISFFYGFLQRVADTDPNLLDVARRVKWLLPSPVLQAGLDALVARFRPRSARTA